MRWCTVTVTDQEGRRHSVDVQATSTFDAAHLCVVEAKKGSAREFEETANWRRLECFALPGTVGFRITVLNADLRQLPTESSAFSESLEYWNSRIVSGADGRCNPLFDGTFGAVWPSRSAPCGSSHHPIELARGAS